MASLPTHGIVGVLFLHAWAVEKKPRWMWWASAACAMVPDLDVIGFRFGVHYGDILGHRGLTHGIAFALAAGACFALTKQRWIAALHFFLVTLSHGALDAMTNGGLGVGFFTPFTSDRYFFPWRPIVVSPIGVARFFSMWGLRVIASEVLYVFVPALILSTAIRALRKRQSV